MISEGEATPALDRARRKAAWRLLPFLFLLYIVAYLDRANVAFARLPMAAELHFSEAVYGFGAGVFFIGYLLLEIPGALIVEHWSARRWIARILVSWGICTALVGCVHTAAQFYGARFLLGAAEAGFFPGIIVYLTHWFRERDRARAMAGFLVAGPAALALGGPLSALILHVEWLHISPWRWLFIVQGAPAVLLGFVCLFYMTDRPRQARWLAPDERDALNLELEREVAARADAAPWWRALLRPANPAALLGVLVRQRCRLRIHLLAAEPAQGRNPHRRRSSRRTFRFALWARHALHMAGGPFLRPQRRS